MRPCLCWISKGREIIERAPQAAPIFGLISIKINADLLACCGQRHQRDQIESRIAERACAFQLGRLCAVRLDLPGDAGARGFGGLTRQLVVADEQREASQLRGVPTAVIILGFGFVFAVRAGLHPIDEFAKPRDQR